MYFDTYLTKHTINSVMNCTLNGIYILRKYSQYIIASLPTSTLQSFCTNMYTVHQLLKYHYVQEQQLNSLHNTLYLELLSNGKRASFAPAFSGGWFTQSFLVLKVSGNSPILGRNQKIYIFLLLHNSTILTSKLSSYM